ncbi:MAG TPA: universal stress protein [Polyangia bacterium]|nr:universal stress protein [Polyangia bacterium]
MSAIVCATDFSPQADAALAWAIALARRSGSHVDLVHVVPDSRDDELLLRFDTAMYDAEAVRKAVERVRAAARTAAEAFDVPVRPHLLRGVTHEVIAKHAAVEDAFMIVLGASRRSSAARLFVGSVADRVVRSSERPVVIVPPAAEVARWSSREAVGERRAPRVVAALGDGDDAELMRFVGRLRGGGAADVTFVHLYWPLGEYERLGLHGRRDLFKPDADVVANLTPKLRTKTDAVAGMGEVELDIRPAWGEPASNLLVAVEDRGADLLVVGAHERHGLSRLFGGAVARRLARHSRYVPVAIVPTVARPPLTTAVVPHVRTVLAATDRSPLGNAGVAHAYSLLRGTGGVVELCYVNEHVLPSPAYAYERPQAALTEVDRALLEGELRALVPPEAESLGIATHVSVVDGGSAAEALVQAAERLDVDVVCLASHGRGGVGRAFLGSVAQDVVRRARRPVFVVRSR